MSDQLETRALIRDSGREVIETLLTETVDDSVYYAIGNLACALADVDGIESAHNFADTAVRRLDIRPADAFTMWLELYRKGDMLALPQARQAAGLASEDLTFVEHMDYMELGSLHSTERAVALVEAGDATSMTLARGLSKNAFVIDRAALFSGLYQAGDQESLDLAIEAAWAAKIETKRSGSIHYARSDRALNEMALYAARNGKIEDSLRLIALLEDPSDVAYAHAELYAQGRTESLPHVVQYLQVQDSPPLERRLARAGYEPAVAAVRKRAMTKLKRQTRATYPSYHHFEDLLALHQIGDPQAAPKLVEIARDDPDIGISTYYLRRVGKPAVALELAKSSYMHDRSPRKAEILLENDPLNLELWRTVFEHTLQVENRTEEASIQIRNLASRMRQQAS